MARPQRIRDTSILDALHARPQVTAAELAGHLGIGVSTATKRLAALETAGQVRREPGGRERGMRRADHWSCATATLGGTANSEPAAAVDADPVAPPVAATDTDTGAEAPHAHRQGAERLSRGALGPLVRDYLAARPDDDLGATQIGTALGRSQGAVANALARLTAAGDARLVSTTPRRYRIATDQRQR